MAPSLKRSVFRALIFVFTLMPGVRAAVRTNAGGMITVDGPLSVEEIQRIRAHKRWPSTFVHWDKTAGLDTLASLEKLPELRSLLLPSSNGNLTSFADLPELPQLVVLKATSLKNAQEKPFSLKPLVRYRELVSLDLMNTPITDADTLAVCTRLRELNLYMAEVDSLEFLRSTPAVASLDLYGIKHRFTSYAPIATLTRLRELNIHGNPQASDASLAPLLQLTRLRKIDLSSTRNVTSLGFLTNCHELETVIAKHSTKLTDLEALSDKTFLDRLDLQGLKIDQIRFLADKPYLTQLDIGGTAVRDLSPLRRSLVLQSLDLAESAVVDLAPLAGLRRLETLNLSGTSVRDLRALREITSLRSLTLSNTPVSDVAPLAGLDRLESLWLDRTHVQDLTPLHSLHNLKRLHIPGRVAPAEIESLRNALPTLDISQH